MAFVIVSLVIGIAIAVFLYSDSGKRQKERGATPFGLSPVLWAVIGFIGGLIGLIVYLIGRSQQDKSGSTMR